MFESWPLYSGVEEGVPVHPPHPTGCRAQLLPYGKRSIAQSSWSRASLVSAVVEVTELALKMLVERKQTCGKATSAVVITLFKVVSVSLSLSLRVQASLLFIVLRSHSCVFLS